jgi:hypothetical protein
VPKRQNTTLKVPKRLVELHGAYLPTIYEEHRLIVEFPFLNRMQPVLVLIDDPNVAYEARGAGIIFPSDAPCGEPFEDPVLAARVGVVGSRLCKHLSHNSGGALVEQLCASTWKEPPFLSQFRPELEKLIGHIIDQWAREKQDWRELESELIEALTARVEKTRIWCPIALEPDWVDFQSDDNWRLLDAWLDWEARSLSARDRADEFYGIKGRHNRFKSKLHYLHLKVSSGRPPRTCSKRRLTG